jgi:hypothetical protein
VNDANKSEQHTRRCCTESTLSSGNACHQANQNVLSRRPLSKKLNIKMYKTVNLLAVLYECEIWPVTLSEEHTQRLSENSWYENICTKRDEVTEGWREDDNIELYSLYLHQILLGWLNQRIWDERDMQHAWERRQLRTEFWFESPKRRDHWGGLGCTWENTIKIDHWKIMSGGGDWNYLAQDSDWWRALMNRVI